MTKQEYVLSFLPVPIYPLQTPRVRISKPAIPGFALNGSFGLGVLQLGQGDLRPTLGVFFFLKIQFLELI